MININENYSIDADQSGYVIYERKVVQNGKHAGEVIHTKPSYYGSLFKAYQGLLNGEMRKYTAEGEKTLSEAFRGLTTVITHASEKYIAAIEKLEEEMNSK